MTCFGGVKSAVPAVTLDLHGAGRTGGHPLHPVAEHHHGSQEGRQLWLFLCLIIWGENTQQRNGSCRKENFAKIRTMSFWGSALCRINRYFIFHGRCKLLIIWVQSWAEIIHHVRWRIIVNIWPFKGRTFQGLISTRVSVENYLSSDNPSKFCTLWLQYSDENYYSSKMNGDFVSFNITPYYSLRKGLIM